MVDRCAECAELRAQLLELAARVEALELNEARVESLLMSIAGRASLIARDVHQVVGVAHEGDHV